MRRGFTLMEMIFVIIVSAIIGYYILANKKQQDFYEEVNYMLQDISNILNNAVMDVVRGYVNGTGGYCSSGTNYIDISASRVIECIGWNSVYKYNGPISTDGKNSYIENLLSKYSNDRGCKMYIDNSGLEPDQYYILIDCSSINFDNSSARYRAFIEDKIDSYIRKNFSTIVQRIDRNAKSIDDIDSGNDKDGIIGFLMKK